MPTNNIIYAHHRGEQNKFSGKNKKKKGLSRKKGRLEKSLFPLQKTKLNPSLHVASMDVLSPFYAKVII